MLDPRRDGQAVSFVCACMCCVVTHLRLPWGARCRLAHDGNAAVFAKLAAFSVALFVLPLVTFFSMHKIVVPGAVSHSTVH